MNEARFMVLAERDAVTVAALHRGSRDEAWTMARDLRAAGHRVWIYEDCGATLTCVVGDDDELDV